MMRRSKEERLEPQGWRFGTAQEFLGLSDEETAHVELRLRLAAASGVAADPEPEPDGPPEGAPFEAVAGREDGGRRSVRLLRPPNPLASRSWRLESRSRPSHIRYVAGKSGVNVVTRVLGVLLAALTVPYVAEGARGLPGFAS